MEQLISNAKRQDCQGKVNVKTSDRALLSYSIQGSQSLRVFGFHSSQAFFNLNKRKKAIPKKAKPTIKAITV